MAGTHREPALRQPVVDLTRKGQQPRRHLRIILCLAALKHQAIILIGADGLLLSPFAAKRQPAPAQTMQLMPQGDHADHVLRQAIVERSDKPGQVFRPYAVRMRPLHQRAHVASCLRQELEPVRACNDAIDTG